MDRSEIVTNLRRNRDAVAPFFSAGGADLRRCYATGKWTIREILAHIADCERINLWRFERAAAEPGSNVEPFEQDDWAATLGYATRPIGADSQLFLGSRDLIIHHMETLPDAVLARECVHPEKGRLAAWQWAALTVGHVDHHLGQLRAASEGRVWTPVVVPNAHLYGVKL